MLHELKFSPWQCTKARHRRGTCDLCVAGCPTGAITFAERPRVAADRCTGCGVCAAVCPSAAFEVAAAVAAWPTSPSREARPTVALTCARAITAVQPMPEWRAQTSVQLPCIGRIDEALLLGAVLAGPYAAVAVRATACAGCPSRSAYSVADRMARRARDLLAAFGRQEQILLEGDLAPAPDPVRRDAALASHTGLSRRKLFSTLLGGLPMPSGPAADTPGGGYLAIDGDEALPHGRLPVRLPARRVRLLAALRAMGQPATGYDGGTGLWAQFGVTKDCTGCGMCAFFCPTGALQKIEDGGRIGLAFQLSDCTNCRLCQEACFWNAVVLSPEIDLRKVVAGTVDHLWPSTSLTGAHYGHPGTAGNYVS